MVFWFPGFKNILCFQEILCTYYQKSISCFLIDTDLISMIFEELLTGTFITFRCVFFPKSITHEISEFSQTNKTGKRYIDFPFSRFSDPQIYKDFMVRKCFHTFLYFLNIWYNKMNKYGASGVRRSRNQGVLVPVFDFSTFQNFKSSNL